MRARFAATALTVLGLLAGCGAATIATAGRSAGDRPPGRPSDDVAIRRVLGAFTYGPQPGDIDRIRQMGLAQGVGDVLHGTGRETFEAVKLLRSAAVTRAATSNGAAYPRGRFGESLRQIAELIRAGVGLEVAFVDCEGWDTHVGQGNEQGRLALRLRDLGTGLAAFAQDLGDRMADVVVLTMSEFGRTVAENGNRGTDHGHATAMLVLGGSVRGGRVYGRWPGLAVEQRFEGRDLAVTTDFRALFSEVAVRHLGIPPSAPVFPGWHAGEPPLGIFS